MKDNFFSDIEIEQIFPLDRIAEIYKDNEAPQIMKYINMDIKNIDLGAYNAVIFNKAHRDNSKKIRRLMSNNNLLDLIEDFYLDEKLETDVHQVGYIDSNYEGKAITLHLARIKKREVFINDLLLANIFKDTQERFLPFQEYSGMGNGIFDEVLSNLYPLLSNKGITTISGHAAHMEQAEIFKRRGFEFDKRDSALLKLGLANGIQIPIYRKI